MRLFHTNRTCKFHTLRDPSPYITSIAVSGASVAPAWQVRAFATFLWRLDALQWRNVHTRFCENRSNGSKLQWCQIQVDTDSMVVKWKERNLKITFHPFEHQNANIFCHNHKIQPLHKHPYSRLRCTNAPGTLRTPLALHSARTNPS